MESESTRHTLANGNLSGFVQHVPPLVLAYDNLHAVRHRRRRLVVEFKSLPVTIASYIEQHAAKQEVVPGHGYPDEQIVSGDIAHE